ncbi:hypothetical protein GCM10011273_07160 [Asticcacaulis endophyticus]|uniref:Uncharacterized protein n=1 Tax=Asticcacaulis endophyticus TaxID=1395890 RepID=A0A918PVF2_9CAUL|nr:hypothetical protein GCM10011273_07160 [Asticcacaulis endophyticus]
MACTGFKASRKLRTVGGNQAALSPSVIFAALNATSPSAIGRRKKMAPSDGFAATSPVNRGGEKGTDLSVCARFRVQGRGPAGSKHRERTVF